MVIATTPISSSVVAAFLLLGLRKAGTPLLIASTPVSAAHPVEKARSTRNAAAKAVRFVCSGWIVKCALGAWRCSCSSSVRNPPHRIRPRTAIMNAYVGMAKAAPDSRMPRRLTTVSRTTMAMATAGLCWPTSGMVAPT
ncbi:hypothetical protein GCM10020001_016640 [Nonomuraea salmonea]